MASWQRDFASGLIVLVPVLVTLVFLAWIYGHLRRVPIPLDPGPLRVLLTLIIFVLLVFSVGYLMRTALGSVLEGMLDDLMNQLPGLRVIYNASKMAIETAVSGTDDLQKPVRIEVWNGLRMTAFKTGNRAPDGREVLFLPTAPNITTGFVIEVEEDRYEEIDDSVEDALTRLISAGFGDNDNKAVAGLYGKPDDEEVPITEVGSGPGEEDAGAAEAEATDADSEAVDADSESADIESDGVETDSEPAETDGGAPDAGADGDSSDAE